MLCAMLCALNLSYRSESPRNRVDLYAKALTMLLHLRDAERGIAGLPGDTGKRVLPRDPAWRLTPAGKVEFRSEEALEHISRKLPGIADVDPEVLFKHLLESSGVLREPVPGRVDTVIDGKLVPPRGPRETQSLASIGHRVLKHLPTSLDGLSGAQAELERGAWFFEPERYAEEVLGEPRGADCGPSLRFVGQDWAM
ncbi:hypothetical protein Q5530_04290 [Saccharothrix sp. BKS2]|uniref:hypothetical protein n=1 Tax=Saccharothrix sp. BKS2 TaxID=3064400 RepID=UPI0039EB744E